MSFPDMTSILDVLSPGRQGYLLCMRTDHKIYNKAYSKSFISREWERERGYAQVCLGETW